MLFVGRGSRDPETPHDIAWYSEGIAPQFPNVTRRIGYLAVNEPAFETVVDELIALGKKEIIVIPFLLFTGMLGQRLKRAKVQRGDEATFHYVPYLGAQPEVADLYAQAVRDAWYV
ncbi:MAG: CbiX/SirB N-terminal domain-containing protein [Bacilli bacterium]